MASSNGRRPRRVDETAIPAEGRLLLWFRRAELERQQAQILAQVILEMDVPPPNLRAAPNDVARLRGIPVIGRGVGGTMPGTQPEAETIRRLS